VIAYEGLLNRANHLEMSDLMRSAFLKRRTKNYFCAKKLSLSWSLQIMIVCLQRLNHGCFLIIGFKG
jgi:hypothetical protein